MAAARQLVDAALPEVVDGIAVVMTRDNARTTCGMIAPPVSRAARVSELTEVLSQRYARADMILMMVAQVDGQGNLARRRAEGARSPYRHPIDRGV